MGCCGCTLQSSAIVAAVFGIIQSVTGFITGIVVLVYYMGYYAIPSDVFSNVLISATVFNGLWLLATIMLIIGIVQENAALHRVWVAATSTIMITDFVHTIGFVMVFVNNISYFTSVSVYSQQNYSVDMNSVFIFALVMTAISRGSIWLWIINICLTIYTSHRANEIARGPMFHHGQTVIVYGNQPAQSYAIPGQTVVVHGGTAFGMPPIYQQEQYGQAKTANPYDPDQTVPAKY